MVLIPTGSFDMGGDNEQARADEFPKHKVTLDAFWIDETEVTNAQFRKFVEATSYVTTAEKDFEYVDNEGKSVHQKAGSLVFNTLKPGAEANPNTWWQFVEGANWKHPQGPNSTIDGKIIIRWCRCPGTTQKPIANGRENVCQQKRNGNVRRAEVLSPMFIPGEMKK